MKTHLKSAQKVLHHLQDTVAAPNLLVQRGKVIHLFKI